MPLVTDIHSLLVGQPAGSAPDIALRALLVGRPASCRDQNFVPISSTVHRRSLRSDSLKGPETPRRPKRRRPDLNASSDLDPDGGLSGPRNELPASTTSGGVDWDAVAAAARYQEVVPTAAAAHQELAVRLHEGRRRQAVVDLHLHIALRRVGAALSSAGVGRAALLKGSGTAYWLYEEPSDRVRRDIDLLVSDTQMEAAVAALTADGWYPGASGPEAARGPLRLRAWPMYLELPIGIVSCDLHRRLTYGARFTVDVEGVLDRARSDLAPTPLPVTSPIDTFVHTALHCALSGFQEPLKAWMDLYQLASRTELTLAWPEVGRVARRWGAANAVWAAATVLERWFHLDLGDLRAAVRPDALTRRYLTAVLSGDGRYPLRADVERRAAVAATALVVCDGARSRADYLLGLVTRRVAPRFAPA